MEKGRKVGSFPSLLWTKKKEMIIGRRRSWVETRVASYWLVIRERNLNVKQSRSRKVRGYHHLSPVNSNLLLVHLEYLIIGWPLQTQLKLSINFKISSIPTGWKMRAFGGSVRARKSVKMTSIRRFAWMGDRYSACVDFQSGKHALMAPTALLWDPKKQQQLHGDNQVAKQKWEIQKWIDT